METRLNNYRNAASVHKNIRLLLKDYIKPGIKLIDICEFIENNIRNSLSNEVNNGIAFPVGVSLNNIAAHWTPQKNDTTVLTENDVLKVDFGTHIDGNIIDSAFTYAYDDKFNPLKEASKEAVYNVIKNIGVGSRISELGGIASEIVNSYEIELENKLIPLKPINNIYGHSIEQWKIHGNKYIYPLKTNNTGVIEENDVLAIEIYVSTGCGTTIMDSNSNHFMLKEKYNSSNLKLKKSRELLNYIKSNFKTLAFTQRYFNDIKSVDIGLKELFNNQIINSYPPLVEPLDNSYISQFEHTIHVSEKNTENFSLGEDY